MVSKKSRSMNSKKTCECHMIKKLFTGAFLILLGLVFLLNAWGLSTNEFTSMAWPTLVAIFGVIVIVKTLWNCPTCGH